MAMSKMMNLQNTPDVLAKIAAYKRDEVSALKARTTIETLRSEGAKCAPPLGFSAAVRNISLRRPALIAEVKKASPSKGLIRADFNPAEIARSYEKGGAACLSVLTDGPGFQGSNEIFAHVRAATRLPLLRKDFMLEPIQIAESRAMGADAILVIMAMLDDKAAAALMLEAAALGMDALVETHDADELARAVHLGAAFIGINNRDLRTFDTTLETFVSLSPRAPKDVTLIAESGVFTPEHIERLTASGADGFLIGESLMRQSDVEKATRKLSGV